MKSKAVGKDKLPTLWPEYTNKELDEFEQFLEKFKEPKEVKVFKKREVRTKLPNDEIKIEWVRYNETEMIDIINLEEAMAEFGALKKTQYMGKPHYGVIIDPPPVDSLLLTHITPSKFELFRHKRVALQDRNSKRQYAKKKETEEYEQMAEIEASEIINEFPK